LRIVHDGGEPGLSGARSLAKLDLQKTRGKPTADEAVYISRRQTDVFVSQLADTARLSAKETFERATEHLRKGSFAPGDRSVRLIHHLLHRKQFRMGSIANYPLELAHREIGRFVKSDEPIQLALVCFPKKHRCGGLKAPGPLPDLAELAFLVRLVELADTLRHAHPAGVSIRLLGDGQHFRRHPVGDMARGMSMWREYIDALAAADVLSFEDYEEALARSVPPAEHVRRRARVADILAEYRRAFAGLDVTKDPARTLSRAAACDPMGNFVPLFRSLIYSVPVPPPPAAMTETQWAREIYSDVYNLTAGPASVRDARREILATTWQDTLRYVSVRHADFAFGYPKDAVPAAVRASTRPGPGKVGLNLLGGATPLPWHGTGAIDARGVISCDFAVSLYDNGFMPVYSPLLGMAQPFAMVPASVTRAGDHRREIAPEFLKTAGLRRR
jgi:hypothetical protein